MISSLWHSCPGVPWQRWKRSSSKRCWSNVRAIRRLLRIVLASVEPLFGESSGRSPLLLFPSYGYPEVIHTDGERASRRDIPGWPEENLPQATPPAVAKALRLRLRRPPLREWLLRSGYLGCAAVCRPQLSLLF